MSEVVRLVAITAEEYPRWAEQSVRGFAAQLVASGTMPEAAATAYAEAQLPLLLPGGLATQMHHLWSVHTDDGPVGQLWLRVRALPNEVEGYVFDVELLPFARGRGLGRATMLAAEEAARGLGATVMRLNVFGHNTAAIRLYERLGYVVTSATLTKRLDRSEEQVTAAGPHVELRDMSPDQLAALRLRLEAELQRPLSDDLDRPGRLRWAAYDGDTLVALVALNLRAPRRGARHRLRAGPARVVAPG